MIVVTSHGKPTAASVAQLRSDYYVTILFTPLAQSQKTLVGSHDCWLIENNRKRIQGGPAKAVLAFISIFVIFFQTMLAVLCF